MRGTLFRPDTRYPADFPVGLAWEAPGGIVNRVTGRCTNLSASGMCVETRDPVAVRATVMVTSREMGRMGHANIRYCRRETMKYVVGLQFSVQLKLAGRVRGTMLDRASGPNDPSK